MHKASPYSRNRSFGVVEIPLRVRVLCPPERQKANFKSSIFNLQSLIYTLIRLQLCIIFLETYAEPHVAHSEASVAQLEEKLHRGGSQAHAKG